MRRRTVYKLIKAHWATYGKVAERYEEMPCSSCGELMWQPARSWLKNRPPMCTACLEAKLGIVREQALNPNMQRRNVGE